MESRLSVPGDGGRYVDEDLVNRKSTRRLFPWIVGLLTTVAVVFKNLATSEIIGRVQPAVLGSEYGVGFGWPFNGFVGYMGAWGLSARSWNRYAWVQDWQDASGIQPQFAGLLANLLVAIILSVSMARAIDWFNSLLRPLFSIATLLGVTGFVAIEFRKQWEISTRMGSYPLRGFEIALAEYCNTVVWISVLVACIAIPNWASWRMATLLANRREKNDAAT
jgi:hypothetical protein